MHPLGCLILLQMRNHCFVSKRLGAPCPEWVHRKFVRSRRGNIKTAKATCLHGRPNIWMLLGSSLGFNSCSAFKFWIIFSANWQLDAYQRTILTNSLSISEFWIFSERVKPSASGKFELGIAGALHDIWAGDASGRKDFVNECGSNCHQSCCKRIANHRCDRQIHCRWARCTTHSREGSELPFLALRRFQGKSSPLRRFTRSELDWRVSQCPSWF